MKHLIHLCLCASVLNLSAAVPLRWTVETSRATPAQFEAYQGETLALEACLQSDGKPLEAPSNYSFFWQTNGMGSAYWSVPCTPPNSNTLNSNNSNTLFATWSPTNDVGSRVYNCFIGQPGTIYHAAFQLRLRPSPGATPNELPLPQKVIDFAKVTVLNPPWSGGGGGVVDTNAVEQISNTAVETNAVTVGLQSSVSSLQSSKADKSTTYTKSETDELLDGKAGVSEELGKLRLDSRITKLGENSDGTPIIDFGMGSWHGDLNVVGDLSASEVSVGVIHLSQLGNLVYGSLAPSVELKANRPVDFDPSHVGNLAALDENGDLADSPVGTDDRGISIGGGGNSTLAQMNDAGVYVESYMPGSADVVVADTSGIVVYHRLTEKADRAMISATNPTFSNAVMSVATGISTNDWAVIASVADWASVIPGGVPTGAGTLGVVLASLAAAVLALKKKTSLLKSEGTAEDDFATDLLGKPVAKSALMIPLEAKTDSFTAEDGHAYTVTMTGTVTITMPTTTEGKAAIFQARFSAAAQQSVQFDTDDVVKFDGADCGIVKAGKDALLSAMWNGEAWDLVWKNQA